MIAEYYEKCVFRSFGTSKAIRHDREPGFMSDLFRAFNRIVERASYYGYRTQENDTVGRIIHTLTRAIKMYVSDENPRYWDEYAE